MESFLSADPIWLDVSDVLVIHERQIARFGGADGMRDQALLESAVYRPKKKFFYHKPPVELFNLAAAYGYGIAKNHPFIDGNKRTAYASCRLFLQLNGADIVASKEDKYLMVIKLAEGMLTEEELTAWLTAHGVKEN